MSAEIYFTYFNLSHLNYRSLSFKDYLIKNFGIELSSQKVSLQVLSSFYNVSQLSSKWISVVPLNTLKTPKQNLLPWKFFNP